MVADNPTKFVATARRLLVTQPSMSLLCYDHALASTPNLRTASLAEIADVLQSHLHYVRLMRQCGGMPVHEPELQRLIGYEEDPSRSDQYLIGPTSILHTHLSGTAEEDQVYHPRADFPRLIGEVLRDRVKTRLESLHTNLRQARALTVCFQYAAFGSCYKECEREHIGNITRNTYNERLLVYLNILLLFSGSAGTSDGDEHPERNHRSVISSQGSIRLTFLRMWLEKLRDVLHPHHYTLGNISSASLPLLPEWNSAVTVLKEWIKFRLYTLKPAYRYPDTFLDTLISTAIMLFDFDRTYGWQTASSFRANFRDPAPGHVLFRPGGFFVVPEILAFLGGQDLGIEKGVFAVE